MGRAAGHGEAPRNLKGCMRAVGEWKAGRGLYWIRRSKFRPLCTLSALPSLSLNNANSSIKGRIYILGLFRPSNNLFGACDPGRSMFSTAPTGAYRSI